MQVYLVGGAVRDALLGREVKDRDWVVVGADADEMLGRGFRTVGRDFPVFLHPETHEEYALARTERKTGKGYAGFVCHADKTVTLEQDLLRRDLTVNAMAQDTQGCLIDPFGGADDLRRGVLRHVSPAFAEDPVRILRTARFAARFGFAVAGETMDLMRQMVEAGEADALVSERVWQELAKGLMENEPRRMLEVLRECGALKTLLPEIDALFGVPQRADFHPEIDAGEHTLLVLQRAAALGLSLPERYAALLHDVGKSLTTQDILPKHIGHDWRGTSVVDGINRRLRPPKECAELARLVCALHIRIHQVGAVRREKALWKVLREADALRRPQRFAGLLNVCLADQQGRLGFEHAPYPQQAHWTALLQAAQSVDAGAVARAYADNPHNIQNALETARCEAMRPVHQAFLAQAA